MWAIRTDLGACTCAIRGIDGKKTLAMSPRHLCLLSRFHFYIVHPFRPLTSAPFERLVSHKIVHCPYLGDSQSFQ
jgi:hypothetical protein